MRKIARMCSLALLLILPATLGACKATDCDASLPGTTLSIDFSRLNIPLSDLQYTLECPEFDSCTYDAMEDKNTLYAANSQYPVSIIPKVTSVRITVVKTSTKKLITAVTEEVVWDPPLDPDSCAAPSNADVKI